MGNAGSTLPRERHKSSSTDVPNSPSLKDGQAFVFDKKAPLIPRGSSNEDDEQPYYTKQISKERESSISSEVELNANKENAGPVVDPNKKKALPTVFKWDGGGKQVFISGTFSQWRPIPMVKSHGDFVTIVDLPEGEHQYKFCVDGEWRHDPKLVN